MNLRQICPCVIRHPRGSEPGPGRQFVDIDPSNKRGDGWWYSADTDCLRCYGHGRLESRAPSPDQGHKDPRCPRCRGIGVDPMSDEEEREHLACFECNGTGQKLLRGEPAGVDAESEGR